MSVLPTKSIPSFDLLITHAQVWEEPYKGRFHIGISQGRIVRISDDLELMRSHCQSHTEHVEAEGLWWLPGCIDTHVHFRDPGLTHKADMASESRAAIAGGVTSFFDMPNTVPQTLSQADLEAKHRLAQAHSFANWAFYIGVNANNLDEVLALEPNLIPGVKLFMGASTGQMLLNEPAALQRLFKESQHIITAHCEDDAMIREALEQAHQRYGPQIPMAEHPLIRSRQACVKATSQAIELAQRFGTQLHIAHLSTLDELALIADAPLKDKSITAEVCLHYLFFDAKDYPHKGTLLKCNPAIKSPEDRQALLDGLKQRRIDTLATDHAPHRLEEKQQDYAEAPSGLASIEFFLPALLELRHQGVIDIEDLIRLTAHQPAERFHIVDRGFTREGFWADGVLVDPKGLTYAQTQWSKCGWNVFDNLTFHGQVISTFVNGKRIFHQGRFQQDQPSSQSLTFNHPH